MRHLSFVLAGLSALSAQSVLAAPPSEQARQNYVCAGAAGLAAEILAKSDPAAARRLSGRADLLTQSAIQFEVGRKVREGDAVAAMVTFLEGQAAAYKTNPAQAVSDLAACRAKGMIPAGPGLTVAQISGLGASPATAPAPASPAAPVVAAAATPPAAKVAPKQATAVAARPVASPDVDFRHKLLGAWGRIKGGEFDSEMIPSTINSPAGLQFTRKACPAGGLASAADLLAHEIWFEQRGDQFGLVRASGEPGKIRTSWTELRFKDQPDGDTFRYSFNRLITADVASTHTLVLKRLGPDEISHRIQLTPNSPGTETLYRRCPRR